MALLPPETFHQILSLVRQDTLLKCRLVNKYLNSLAIPRAFGHIWLEAAGDVSRFVKISQTPYLCSQVREVNIATTIRPSWESRRDAIYRLSPDFFLALPRLRFFSRLVRLNLIFNEYCGKGHEDYLGYSIEENFDFRYWVMWTAFSCLTGEWTAQKSFELYKELDVTLYEGGKIFDAEMFLHRLTSEVAEDISERTNTIQLEALTIRNLAAYEETRLTSSNILKKVLSTVTELKIYVVVEGHERYLQNDIYLPEPYLFMESLIKTWLAPEVAKNLRVLSLFCEAPWGWVPRMDFRDVNPGTGFPKLEVLALGNYIFSHEWQVHWFASQGRQNGHGGLLELYLDDCPILYFFQFWGTLDTSPGSAGYPLTESIFNERGESETTQYNSLRWDHILSHWRQSMTALKVLVMGDGLKWTDLHTQRFDRTNFTTYSSPPNEVVDWDYGDFMPWFGGVGIRTYHNIALQYVEFDQEFNTTPWMIDEGANADFERPQESDIRELENFLAVIKSRT
ncbi:hypothetical protein F5Y13DRAFT_200271 [Hypoxylon sp. FL1857]|nr:hypothetical protein F5Y13DRAFT_200271 [Hypoxylon sp. FL1857]